MISIPVSFLLAAIFLGLGLLAVFWRALPLFSRLLFAVFFFLLCVEAGLVGLRFAHGNVNFLALQRSLPVWIAPTLYLAFATLTVPFDRAKRLIRLNALVAASLTLAMMLPVPIPGFVDVIIGMTFAVYCLALFLVWIGGPDRLSEAPTGQSGLLHKLQLVAILVMAATLATDAWIGLLFAQQKFAMAADIISYASLAFLLAAFGLAVLALRYRPPRRSEKNVSAAQADKVALVEAARRILLEQELYRDPALTLTRLARRTGTPDRDLSQAVNKVVGVNVSQFVNQIRLEEAARLLAETNAPVTRIHEQVGFLTRSNFYREFQRMFEEAPGAYRKNIQSSPDSRSRYSDANPPSSS